MYVCALSCVQLFAISWAVAHQAPLSMGFPRQEYWSGLPVPPPGDLPDTGLEPSSLLSPALAGRFFTSASAGKLQIFTERSVNLKYFSSDEKKKAKFPL